MTREQWDGPWCDECDTGVDAGGYGHMLTCSKWRHDVNPKTQESIDWLNRTHQRTVSDAITDDVLVQLFYAANGDITQFRIKARKIIKTAAATAPLLSPAAIEPEPITPEMELVYSVWRQFKKDSCVPGDDRVSEAFFKAARVLMGSVARAELTNGQIMEIWHEMPGGDKGFMVDWGYLQFARAILAAGAAP